MRPSLAIAFATLVLSTIALPCAALSAPKLTQFRPSAADSGVKMFDDNNMAFTNASASPDAPLIVFLNGTGSKPESNPNFLRTLANFGFPVLGLAYNDDPAVAQVCPHDPDANCSEAFRRMRSTGDGTAKVANPTVEGIEARLTAALTYLAARDPSWGRYLKNGQPRWDRLVLGGLSQGAGMAAYLAKHHEVARVVLFSSPWDTTGADRHPAPWLSQPSATPMERWYAEYHARENTAGLIRNAYAALEVPVDHVRIFNLDLPSTYHGTSPNPFHGHTIADPRYEDQWRFLFTGQ